MALARPAVVGADQDNEQAHMRRYGGVDQLAGLFLRQVVVLRRWLGRERNIRDRVIQVWPAANFNAARR